jgi:cation diffusion facilitator family transporter
MQECSIEPENKVSTNEVKTKWVLMITLVTMVVEIVVGYSSGSMALLADGWHMGSHALALGLSVMVYWLYRQPWFREKFSFGGGKILSLGGYTSALFLIGMALMMMVESLLRFFSPVVIDYQMAMWVAIIGLLINLLCAYILSNKSPVQKEEIKFTPHVHKHHCGHDHGHSHSHSHSHSHHDHDHNHDSALFHILSDALTSLLAIVALFLGQKGMGAWIDPAIGVLGGILVLKWGFKMVKASGLDLMDAHEATVDQKIIKTLIEKEGAQIKDLHVWRLGPKDVACELILKNASKKASFYKERILKELPLQHLIIEIDD